MLINYILRCNMPNNVINSKLSKNITKCFKLYCTVPMKISYDEIHHILVRNDGSLCHLCSTDGLPITIKIEYAFLNYKDINLLYNNYINAEVKAIFAICMIDDLYNYLCGDVLTIIKHKYILITFYLFNGQLINNISGIFCQN